MAQATADDHGPVVNVVAWFLLVVTLITVIARTGIKWALTRIMKVDDVIILAASAFAIAQSVAVTRGVIPNGLGRHSIYRTTSQDILFQKFYYASVLLYIPCICLSKLAVLFLLRDVTPVVRHRKIMFNVGALTVAWAIAAESAMAFQCKLPTPWAIFEGHCLDIVSSSKYTMAISTHRCVNLDCVLVLLWSRSTHSRHGTGNATLAHRPSPSHD